MKIKKDTFCFGISIFVIFVLAILCAIPQPQAAPYYQGKTITFIVGFAPGGAYDRNTRLLARYLPKYIPGEPALIVQNMPGGSSMIAANHVFRVSKPDGLTIGSINQGLQIAQLMKVKEMTFDLRKFAWIGSTGSDTNIFCIRSDLPYRTFEEFRKANRKTFISSGGPMTNSFQFVALAKEYARLNLQIITYTNMADALLAVERKETEGTAGTYGILGPLVERGVLRPLLRGRNSEPDIDHLPVDEDAALEPIGKKIMAMRSAADTVGKPYVAPSGTPPEAMTILRNAFIGVLKDPQFLADAKRNMLPVNYLSPEECMKAMNFLLNQPEDVVREFKKYIKY